VRSLSRPQLRRGSPDPRARVLEAAYARNPERFVRRAPLPPELPTAAWINKPQHEGGRSLNSNSDRLIRLDRLRSAKPPQNPPQADWTVLTSAAPPSTAAMFCG